MTEKRLIVRDGDYAWIDTTTGYVVEVEDAFDLINQLHKENEQLKKELKRCKDWINSDKYDYELTLAFIKSKGHSLKDVLEYEKELKFRNCIGKSAQILTRSDWEDLE